ncbi:MAG: hypothetical protein JW940_03390 [Polyangiaceae bacterium]|nr:hypothetical protein [Polyangiaceae bacterium]
MRLPWPEGLRLATRLGVAQVPTFVFLGADHGPETVLVGEHALDELRAAAAGLLRAACGAIAPGTASSEAKGPAPKASEPTQASCSTTSRAAAGAEPLSCSG